MAVDCYLKIDGVDGESVAVDHKQEIEVLSWSWNVSNPTSARTGGGSGKGKATPGDMTVTHHFDKASPVLAKHCASGKHFSKAVLSCRKSGEGQKDYLKITMKEVFVSSVQPSGSQHGDITESVTFSYKDIEFGYKPQDDKGGLGGEVKFGWDTATTEIR